MRALPFLFLTAAYFAIAFASYSQVSAEDAAVAARAADDCRTVVAGLPRPDCVITGSN